LYINKKWLAADNFPFAGWRSVETPGKMDNLDLELKNEASVIESGCPHFPNIFALGGALEMFSKIGAENVMNRVLFLNHLLEEKLRTLGIEIIVQKEDKHRSGILIAKIPNPKMVVDELFKKNIIVYANIETKNSQVIIRLFDMSGRILYDKKLNALQEGNNVFYLQNFKNLSAGNYIFYCMINGKEHTSIITKLK